MKTLEETWLERNFPTMKFAESWRDCVPVIDTTDEHIKMTYIYFKVENDIRFMTLSCNDFPVEYTMTEEEVGKKVLSMLEEFPVFEKMLYPGDYSNHPHCKSNEVWDCLQVNRASHRVAQVTRRGRGNIVLDNRIVLYIGTGKMFSAVDAGIAVAHNNGMYGIATIHNWKDYGVILK